ncbi:hypothetical protein R1flu_024869 [Riccia fluitans]|uniref:Uncharacterized protein n=1 Tax=Riccia fluitans TaxID=41844 RepID=A0ABD1XW47_9MARC
MSVWIYRRRIVACDEDCSLGIASILYCYRVLGGTPVKNQIGNSSGHNLGKERVGSYRFREWKSISDRKRESRYKFSRLNHICALQAVAGLSGIGA